MKEQDDVSSSFSVGIEGITVVWLWVVHGDEGVSDREHWFYIKKHPSCFRLCWWCHNMFEFLENSENVTVQFWIGRVIGRRAIAKVEMARNVATGFGKN